MLRLVDAATRASVVFYGVDTREGMPPLETAGRTQLPESATITNNQSLDRLNLSTRPPLDDPQKGAHDYLLARGGGEFLASQTGGLMVSDANDISYAIGRAVGDQSSYYLIGFTPPEELFGHTPGSQQ